MVSILRSNSDGSLNDLIRAWRFAKGRNALLNSSAKRFTFFSFMLSQAEGLLVFLRGDDTTGELCEEAMALAGGLPKAGDECTARGGVPCAGDEINTGEEGLIFLSIGADLAANANKEGLPDPDPEEGAGVDLLPIGKGEDGIEAGLVPVILNALLLRDFGELDSVLRTEESDLVSVKAESELDASGSSIKDRIILMSGSRPSLSGLGSLKNSSFRVLYSRGTALISLDIFTSVKSIISHRIFPLS